MIKMKGKVRYSPIRNNIISNVDIVILDVDSDELCNYQQWFVNRHFGVKLHPPMFGTHVTIIKPMEINKDRLWKKHENEIIEFQYGDLERHWGFWSLNIKSKDLVEIRRELDLNLYYRLHMTIGKQDDWQYLHRFDNVRHESDFLEEIQQ